MNEAVCRKVATVAFWEGYAKWYKLWLDHTDYHKPIVELLAEMVEPGWRVLDIGAGSGVLAFPLAQTGCEVTALEPSLLMRSFLFTEMFKRHTDRVEVDDSRWEDVSLAGYPHFDLVLSCNSLHLTTLGFEAALDKVFASDPARALVVTEHVPGMAMRFAYKSHVVAFARSYMTNSSFAYHHLHEVFDHQEYKKGRDLTIEEKAALARRVVIRDDHLWLEDQARVGMYWFNRRGRDSRADRQ